MKTCTRCGTRKDDHQFHTIIVNGTVYLHSYCKLCQRLLARERYRNTKAGSDLYDKTKNHNGAKP